MLKYVSVTSTIVLAFFIIFCGDDLIESWQLNQWIVSLINHEGFIHTPYPDNYKQIPFDSKIRNISSYINNESTKYSFYRHLLRLQIYTPLSRGEYPEINTLIDYYVRDPLFLNDLFWVLNHTGRSEDVIDLVQEIKINQYYFLNERIKEQALIAYNLKIKEADSFFNRSEFISEALAISPHDIYSSYKRYILDSTSVADKINILRNLKYFSPTSISPYDPIMLSFIIDIVPDLLDNSIWNIEQVLRILSFWIIKYPHSQDVVSLIETLKDEYPDQVKLYIYEAEYYQRIGLVDEARKKIEQALLKFPDNNELILKYGYFCVANKTLCDFDEVCGLIETIKLSDSDSISHLVGDLCQYNRSENIQEIQIDKLIINSSTEISELDDVKVDTLGEVISLETYPLFDDETQSQNSHWRIINLLDNQNFNKANFVVSLDTFDPFFVKGSGVVFGLWHGEQDRSKTISMNGFRLWDLESSADMKLNILPDEEYLLSVLYRTEPISDSSRLVFFVNLGEEIGEFGLENSNSKWENFQVLICNQSSRNLNLDNLYLRTSLLGRTWIKEVSIIKLSNNRLCNPFS